MITRRRLAVLVLFALVASSGFVASAAIAPGSPVKQPADVDRVHRYYGLGPRAAYTVDSGSIALVAPLVFRLPGESTRVAVAEASFRYRTRGDGPFTVDLGVRRVGGKRATVRPEEFILPPAPDGDVTTVRFLVPRLDGGRRYQADVGVNTVVPDSGVNSIRTRKMLVTVELSPR